MTENRRRPATLHVQLAYRDAPAAIRWLEEAFGFATTVRFADDAGGIAHAELRRGDAAFTVFSDAGADYDRPALKGLTVGHGMIVSLADAQEVDAVFAAARDAGATIVIAPEGKPEWGQYRCRVLDLEGYEWTFGTFRPGERQPDGDAEGN